MDIERFIIHEENTIIEAMSQLDKVATKVLFLTENGKLCGALTDGDIRRWILNKGDLQASVRSVANYSPKYLVNVTREEALTYMKQHSMEALPILDAEKRIIKIILWNEKEYTTSKSELDIPVVMMAGGKGTRLYPYTSILPKPLIPINEIPISEHIMNQFYEFGCKDFYLIVNHKKNMIKAYYNEVKKDYCVYYVDEEKPLGTGGGLSLLKGQIESTFILTNCDILIREDFEKIYREHKQSGNIITMICSLKNFVIPYGVVEVGKNGTVDAMREKPQLSFLTNTGCYIVEPEVIQELPVGLNIGFPDIVQMYKDKGRRVGVYPIGEDAWMDMGQMEEMEKMCERLK